jgi:hypothetical protein
VRVLHITEVLGCGVGVSTGSCAGGNRFEVIVAHPIRPDTPRQEKLETFFPSPIRRLTLQMVTPVSPFADMITVIKIFRLIREIEPAVVHLHSSRYAGKGCGKVGRCRSQGILFSQGIFFLRKDALRTKRLRKGA